MQGFGARKAESEFFIDNLLVRVHFIIIMVGWTGLASWELEFPFPGSLPSTFDVRKTIAWRQPDIWFHVRRPPCGRNKANNWAATGGNLPITSRCLKNGQVSEMDKFFTRIVRWTVSRSHWWLLIWTQEMCVQSHFSKVSSPTNPSTRIL